VVFEEFLIGEEEFAQLAPITARVSTHEIRAVFDSNSVWEELEREKSYKFINKKKCNKARRVAYRAHRAKIQQNYDELGDIVYWGFMKSGVKYELFRVAQAYGEVITPTINNVAISTRCVLRVYNLPAKAISSFISTLPITSPITIQETGFDFEKSEGTPIIIFSTLQECNQIWQNKRKSKFTFEDVEYTVELARVLLRRSKLKHNNVIFDSLSIK